MSARDSATKEQIIIAVLFWLESSDRYLILDKDGDEAGIIMPDSIRGKGYWIIETKK